MALNHRDRDIKIKRPLTSSVLGIIMGRERETETLDKRGVKMVGGSEPVESCICLMFPKSAVLPM